MSEITLHCIFLKNDSRGVKTEPNNMLVALEAESVSYFMF